MKDDRYDLSELIGFSDDNELDGDGDDDGDGEELVDARDDEVPAGFAGPIGQPAGPVARWPDSIAIEQDGYGIHHADVYDARTGERVLGVTRVEFLMDSQMRISEVRVTGTRVARPRLFSEYNDFQVVIYPVCSLRLRIGREDG